MNPHTDMPEIADADAWPVVEIKRQPGGRLGVALTFPITHQSARRALGVDEVQMNMEPQRAKRLRDQLTAHLEEMGFT